MYRRLVIFLAVCAIAAAMVPRDRRAVNTEEEEETARAKTNTTSVKTPKICGPQMPCQWVLYYDNHETMVLPNPECNCTEAQECKYFRVNMDNSSLEYLCRPRESSTDDSPPSEDS